MVHCNANEWGDPPLFGAVRMEIQNEPLLPLDQTLLVENQRSLQINVVGLPPFLLNSMVDSALVFVPKTKLSF